MKKVLIVEDERLIRQGIKSMLQRSGVPIEEILECNNGETALEIVSEQKVDLMFTDIRMPKMNGIELVQHVQNCKNIPIIVAISGYDDFSYAVEMLRNGVREYILKPVEREKIWKVTRTIEQELSEKQIMQQVNKKLGHSQIRFLLTAENMQQDDLELLEKRQLSSVFEKGYILCAVKRIALKEKENLIIIQDLEIGDIIITTETEIDRLLEMELSGCYVGISKMHHGLKELSIAYKEASEARKRSFVLSTYIIRSLQKKPNIIPELQKNAEKFISSTANVQRVQMLGTDKFKELKKSWEDVFQITAKERITPEEFKNVISNYVNDVETIYRHGITDLDRTKLGRLQDVFSYDSLKIYQAEFMDMMELLNKNIVQGENANSISKKMKQAIDFIHQNYDKDLNMAVVSNHISMNYSLFSYNFKQYTGNSFVYYLRDLRIQEAKRLLSETDLKIIEISQAVGYENEKNFMKIFKSIYGVSASEFRRNMKQHTV